MDNIYFGKHEIKTIKILHRQYGTDMIFFWSTAPTTIPAYNEPAVFQIDCRAGDAEEWLKKAFGVDVGDPRVEVINQFDPNRPTVAEIGPLVAELYSKHSAGCCLHVQLDDGNLEDWFFGEEERSRCCPEHVSLFDALRKMSKTQREKVIEKWRPHA